MGEVLVPIGARWGAQTERAVRNFPISGMSVDADVVQALARVKGMAAIVNERLHLVPKDIAIAIAAAAAEVAEGQWADQFPVDVFQTGSGTSTNMNMNEVLANLASERLGGIEVHPNDHVNAAQSSNDVFPSAVHIACALAMRRDLVPALARLAKSLRRCARRFGTVVKAGRTHLMDATPVTLGQEFGGFAAQVEHAIERVEAVLPRVGELPLGGTAVGTGLNAPKGWAKAVITRIAAATELPLSEARDHFEAQGARDALVDASGVLRTVAVSLYKIANDLRWMASGPNCGLAEIRLPDLQPGSSIMPGKVNPVVPEAVCQVVAQVVGNDAAVAFGGSAGNFELNVMVPVIARNLLESVHLLASASRALSEKCVDGIDADEERCRQYAMASPSIVTALNPLIGYERAADVVKQARASGRDVRSVVVQDGLLSAEEAERALDPLAMTRGGLARGNGATGDRSSS
jgi:fumarate hydratase class II